MDLANSGLEIQYRYPRLFFGLSDMDISASDANLYVAEQHFAISLAQPSTFNLVQPWIMGAVGNNTLGNAVTGAGFGDGVPIAVWINQSTKTSL
ncbi:MAG: hypothetical protein WAU62_13970 [Dehalococcoidales bacterium]